MRSSRSDARSRFVWLDGVSPAAQLSRAGPAPASPVGYDAALDGARRAMRRGDWAGAEAYLMRAAPLAAEDPAFFILVGVVREARGDRRAARKYYGRAIRADGNYPAAQQNMRRLYEIDTFGRTREPVALGDESVWA